MPANISKHIRDTVTALLSSETVGFNPTLAALCTQFQVPTFSIDFIAKTKNFIQGWFAAKDVIATSTLKLPLMCFYGIKSQNQNTQKFTTFSGSVMMGLDTYISFPSSQAPNTADNIVDAVEGTLYTVFDSPANYSYYGDVQFNGDLLVKRGPISMGGSNWIQPVFAGLTFDLIVA
jgi:hypothetical protein